MGRPAQVTKEQVLRTAREAFAQRGFEGATLELIGRRLGISAAAVLRHAPSKDALFRESMNTIEPEMRLPVEFLSDLTGIEDPRLVLRRLGKTMVPFLMEKMGEGISLWMHAGNREGTIGIAVPTSSQSIRQRIFEAVGDYFVRAAKAKRMQLKDPRIAAVTFLGSLHAYAFMHTVLHLDPPIPLERYLDSLIQVWTHGGIRSRRKRK